MSFFNRRVSIMAALAAAFSISNHGLGAGFLGGAKVGGVDRYGGNTKHRRSRIAGPPKIRRPVPYAQPSPKVDGVRMRYQKEKLVPRDTPAELPLRKRVEERQRAARLRLKAAQEQAPRKKKIPRGTYFRGDMKGAMRAARRAGVISARQQRKLNKAGRARL